MYFSTQGAGTDFLKEYPQEKLLWEQLYTVPPVQFCTLAKVDGDWNNKRKNTEEQWLLQTLTHHHSLNKHSVNWTDVKVLTCIFTDDYNSRIIREAFSIQTARGAMNRDGAIVFIL